MVPVLVSATTKKANGPVFTCTFFDLPLCSSTNRGVSTQCLYGFEHFAVDRRHPALDNGTRVVIGLRREEIPVTFSLLQHFDDPLV